MKITSNVAAGAIAFVAPVQGVPIHRLELREDSSITLEGRFVDATGRKLCKGADVGPDTDSKEYALDAADCVAWANDLATRPNGYFNVQGNEIQVAIAKYGNCAFNAGAMYDGVFTVGYQDLINAINDAVEHNPHDVRRTWHTDCAGAPVRAQIYNWDNGWENDYKDTPP